MSKPRYSWSIKIREFLSTILDTRASSEAEIEFPVGLFGEVIRTILGFKCLIFVLIASMSNSNSSFPSRSSKNEFEFDIDAMRTKIRHLKPKIVLITSPNNPTGNSISASELARVSSIVDKNSLILIDQEYLGFDISYRDSKF